MEADGSRCGSATNSTDGGPVRSGPVRATGRNLVEDWSLGTKEKDDSCQREQRRLLTTTGTEWMWNLGLQLLPQVYGLLYARPPSTICVSRATEDRLQAQARHIMHRNHLSAGNQISLHDRPGLHWPKLNDLDREGPKEAYHFLFFQICSSYPFSKVDVCMQWYYLCAATVIFSIWSKPSAMINGLTSDCILSHIVFISTHTATETGNNSN